MRPPVSSVRVDRQGWGAEFEPVEPSRGAVALLAGRADEAACLREVRSVLHEHGLSTLWVDPGRSPGLEPTVSRLLDALEWLQHDRGGVPAGVFACGQGALAALHAAALRPARAAALVVQGVEPERVIAQLPQVLAATLMVVGDADPGLVKAHRRLLPLLGGARRLEVVPGAGVCGGSGAASQAVAHLAAEWFAHQLRCRPLH